ncbi:MAG: hypothetical protein IPM02_28430 [Betaproteobacteria bacterium]|nr:hypothetical protein [Betaproteobacteria bacterium]
MNWRIKGCIQGVLSRLPAGARLNSLLQSLLGGRTDEARHIDLKFRADWLTLMSMLQRQKFGVRDRVLMEIGTGWLPVLPLCFALAGARQVHSYDLHRHLIPRAASTVLRQLEPQLIQLAALMNESARLLRDSGLVLHSVNCGDHYAYFDRSITPIHYLRFTTRQWRRWNNELLFQNRLRPSDFTAAAEGAGLRVVSQNRTLRQDLLENLPHTPIAPEFQHYSADELCTTSVTFVAQAGDSS